MSPTDSFIEAALSTSSGSPEVRLHLRGELETAAKDVSDENLTRFAEVLRSSRKPSRAWRPAALLSLLAILFCLWTTFRYLWTYRNEGGLLITFLGSNVPMSIDFTGFHGLKDPTEVQRRLLIGQPDRGHDRYRGWWEQEPQNPVAYQQYALTYFASSRALPPDFTAQARTIDSSNGYLLLIAAGEVTKKASAGSTILPVTNPGFREALDLFHEAAMRPVIRDETFSLGAEVLKAMPEPDGLLGTQAEARFMLRHCSPFQQLAYLPRLISAAASDCEARGDAAGFITLCREWEAVCGKLVADRESSFYDVVTKRILLSSTMPDLLSTAAALHLPEESARMQAIQDQLNRLTQAEKAFNKEWYSFRSKASLTALLKPLFPMAELDPDLAAPGRYQEHALLQCVLCALLCVAVLSGIAALPCFRFRTDPGAVSLSNLQIRLLPVRAMAFAVLAALLPFSLMVILTWIPQGITSRSIWYDSPTALFATVGTLLSGLLLSLLFPAVVLRHYCRKLPFPPKGSKLLVIEMVCASAGCLLAAFLLLPSVSEGNQYTWLAALVPAGICLIYLPLRAFFASLSRRPYHLTIARLMMAPGLAFAVLLALLQPVLRAQENYWSRQDTLSLLTADHPLVTRYEALLMAPGYHGLRDVLPSRSQER